MNLVKKRIAYVVIKNIKQFIKMCQRSCGKLSVEGKILLLDALINCFNFWSLMTPERNSKAHHQEPSMCWKCNGPKLEKSNNLQSRGPFWFSTNQTLTPSNLVNEGSSYHQYPRDFHKKINIQETTITRRHGQRGVRVHRCLNWTQTELNTIIYRKVLEILGKCQVFLLTVQF